MHDEQLPPSTEEEMQAVQKRIDKNLKQAIYNPQAPADPSAANDIQGGLAPAKVPTILDELRRERISLQGRLAIVNEALAIFDEDSTLEGKLEKLVSL